VAELRHINLAILRDTMTSILDWLEGAASGLSDHLGDME
jgi:hypothetical protein